MKKELARTSKKVILAGLLGLAATSAMADSTVKIFGKERLAAHKDQTCRIDPLKAKWQIRSWALFYIDPTTEIHDLKKFESYAQVGNIRIPLHNKTADFYWVNEDGTCGGKLKKTEFKGKLEKGRNSS